MWMKPFCIGSVSRLCLALCIIMLNHPKVIFAHLETPEGKDCTCEFPKLSGVVDDCCCDFETVDSLNNNLLNPVLTELVTTPFFRYFKVRLWCDCPFWPDDGMCHLRDCSVCECSEDEIPLWLKGGQGVMKSSEIAPFGAGGGAPLLAEDSLACQEGRPHSSVDRNLDGAKFHQWKDSDNPWTHEDETDNEEMTYVNLLLNPERYTGYKGESARRIWEAIYAENCFQGGLEDTCTERRIFYRLISGLHSSITAHICGNYLLDEEKGKWGPHMGLFRDRLALFPQRIQNLYFVFLFVLRAATKASDYLSNAEYSTGNPQEDELTSSLVRQLVLSDRLRSACPVPFDEAQLWKGKEGPLLKQELQNHFRNISKIMDCVGCEKCRLWGKLQLLGLATSLKIVFTFGEPENKVSSDDLLLQRNEVIALINLLGRLSESVKVVSELMDALRSGEEAPQDLITFKPQKSNVITKLNSLLGK